MLGATIDKARTRATYVGTYLPRLIYDIHQVKHIAILTFTCSSYLAVCLLFFADFFYNQDVSQIYRLYYTESLWCDASPGAMSHQRYPSIDPVKEPHSVSLKVLR